MDFWTCFSRAADILTVVAAGIAILGVISACLTRPRVTVQSAPRDDGLTLHLGNTGSNPAYNLEWIAAAVNDLGEARRGDGDPWPGALWPGEYRQLNVLTPADNPVHVERRIEDREITSPMFSPAEGTLVIIRWKHAIVPWLHDWVAVRWTRIARESGEQPETLRGIPAWWVFRAAHKYERKKT